MSEWQQERAEVIASFLAYLNEKNSDYVLKGETALLMCYGLDRNSEDVDLDGKAPGIAEIVKDFCDTHNYTYRVAKDTDTVKRYMINYGTAGRPMKVEISFRRKVIRDDELRTINGILTYDINTLCIMKTNAYAGRDTIRDLYDLSFICRDYYGELAPQTIAVLRGALEYKGIEQFDYIVREQHDELIDEGRLANDFLAMFDRLGLLYDDTEREIIQTHKITNHSADCLLSVRERMEHAAAEAEHRNDSNCARQQFLDKTKDKDRG
jgi:hypothetical protein